MTMGQDLTLMRIVNVLFWLAVWVFYFVGYRGGRITEQAIFLHLARRLFQRFVASA
jgi:hypothetical protein